MKTRTAVVASAGWVGVVLVLATAAFSGEWSRADAGQRDRLVEVLPAMLGAACTFIVVGWSCIWAKWWFDRRW